ncbi:cytochrome c biogenesis protein CcdA [Dactylosporangium sp. CS-033363]|uniref:cytochrome c biogenesis protein CcdA n=1 Tax=Dactylosporangium sp. CS-033363 TaxID=3239935 RepID=UPI003D8FED33
MTPGVTLVVIGFLGGLITAISPCILPVLPVVLLAGGAQGAREPGAEPDRRTRFNRRPYLVVLGLTLSFSTFTLLGTLLLRALSLPGDVIRWAGLAVLVLLGIGMMVPRVEALLEAPFSWIPQRPVTPGRGGFGLGLALGAVYVPCAGPVLAAISVAGATGRIGGGTILLTLAFAAGNALPLLVFALAGRRVAERVRAFRRRQRGIRIAAGAVVVALAVALTFNATDAVQRAIPDYATGLNNQVQALGNPFGGSGPLAGCIANAGSGRLQDCGPAPQITGIDRWLNTPGDAPIGLDGLKGQVVLVDFWAYSCINCQRAIAHVDAWYTTYHPRGLEVIGVHAPEYAFEHDPGNVAAGAARLGIAYPVALDNNLATWNNYQNQYWPADYLIDSNGTVRYVSYGEGDYSTVETIIRQLLTAASPAIDLPAPTDVADTTPSNPEQTAETYLGSARANNYAGDRPLAPDTGTFTAPPSLPRDSFALSGVWTVTAESLTAGAGAVIELNFDAADVYLDAGGTGTITATADGATTTLQVSGAPNIITVAHRDQPGRGTLRLTLTPGLNAYSFTFG